MSDEKKKQACVCADCGSEDVLVNAYATWDKDNQRFEVQNTFEKGGWCNTCDKEVIVSWVDIAEEPTDRVDTKTGNTRFLYIYRDVMNFKVEESVIFKGPVDAELEKRVLSALRDGTEFIPSRVGIPELGFDEEDDFSWHEFVKLETTTREADDEKDRSIAEFADELEKIGPDGWERCAPGSERMAPGR